MTPCAGMNDASYCQPRTLRMYQVKPKGGDGKEESASVAAARTAAQATCQLSVSPSGFQVEAHIPGG
jgi:hypothetical protein